MNNEFRGGVMYSLDFVPNPMRPKRAISQWIIHAEFGLNDFLSNLEIEDEELVQTYQYGFDEFGNLTNPNEEGMAQIGMLQIKIKYWRKFIWSHFQHPNDPADSHPSKGLSIPAKMSTYLVELWEIDFGPNINSKVMESIGIFRHLAN